jgi:hypothetical protein
MSFQRRMPASSGYIGFGNKSSVFNRKPKVAFEKIRSYYDQELDKVFYAEQEKQQLSDAQREAIKASIRRKLEKERREEIFYAFIALLFGLGLIYLAIFYVY